MTAQELITELQSRIACGCIKPKDEVKIFFRGYEDASEIPLEVPCEISIATVFTIKNSAMIVAARAE